jgi:tRNA pseudouridine-54 N-methylase
MSVKIDIEADSVEAFDEHGRSVMEAFLQTDPEWVPGLHIGHGHDTTRVLLADARAFVNALDFILKENGL